MTKSQKPVLTYSISGQLITSLSCNVNFRCCRAASKILRSRKTLSVKRVSYGLIAS